MPLRNDLPHSTQGHLPLGVVQELCPCHCSWCFCLAPAHHSLGSAPGTHIHHQGENQPPKPWKDNSEDTEELPKPLAVHHREQLRIAHATDCVTAEDARNFSKIIFRLCRSHAQQNPDLQKGHPTDATTVSADSNPWHKIPLPKATPSCQVARCREQPSHKGSHAAKEIAALPRSSLQKRPLWLQHLQRCSTKPHAAQRLGSGERMQHLPITLSTAARSNTCILLSAETLLPRNAAPVFATAESSLSHAWRSHASKSCLQHADPRHSPETFSKKRVCSTELRALTEISPYPDLAETPLSPLFHPQN